MITHNARDLARALELVSEDVRRRFVGLVQETAEALAEDIQAGYARVPDVTGNLKRAGVGIKYTRGSGNTEARVRSKAPHAHLIEFGTAERTTRAGASRGAVKPPRIYPTTIPAAHRRMKAFLVESAAALGDALQKVRT